MKLFLIKKIKGFTLIEALVSMAIILVAVVAPLGFISNAITVNKEGRDRVVASFLAEEIVENFRAYRDAFIISCKDINYSTGVCTYAGSNITISSSILQDTSDPMTIAWNIFLERLDRASLLTASDVYFDNDSFYFNSLLAPTSKPACSTLKYSSVYGYNCNNLGTNTNFRRITKLTKVSPTILKIEVEVIYTKPKPYLNKSKSVKVIDYIYER